MNKAMTKGRIVGIVGLVLFVIGIFGWQSVVNGSPDSIELTESAQWGLLVGMFFFFEAVGSGFLLVGAVKKHAGALLVGVVAIIGACVMILMDLYHPAAAWRLFLTPNIGSPMFLDVLFSALCIVFGLALLVALRKGSESLIRIMSVLVAVVAVLFPLGTAWLCTTLPGQQGWSTLELASFLVAVGVSAGAAMAFCRMEGARPMLVGFLAAALILSIADAGFLLYGTDESLTAIAMREVVSGKYAPLFWTVTLACELAPMVLALARGVDARIAAGLGIAGIAINKYLFAVKGNLFPYISMPDVKVQLLSLAQGYPVTSYFPHVGEWIACVGTIGLVVAIVAFVLPAVTKEA